MQIGFGDFFLDLDRRALFRGEDEVHLSPKAYRLLAILLEERPRALSKEELKERLWPDTFVLETNLASLAAEIRRALGERGRRSGLLRTVHGFGYSFAGEARELGERARASGPVVGRLVGGGIEVELRNGEHVVGRDPDVAVLLDEATISRRHARIAVAAGAVTIEDLGSKNGTLVRGRAVLGATTLVDGDEVRFGSVALRFRSGTGSGSTATLSAGATARTPGGRRRP